LTFSTTLPFPPSRTSTEHSKTIVTDPCVDQESSARSWGYYQWSCVTRLSKKEKHLIVLLALFSPSFAGVSLITLGCGVHGCKTLVTEPMKYGRTLQHLIYSALHIYSEKRFAPVTLYLIVRGQIVTSVTPAPLNLINMPAATSTELRERIMHWFYNLELSLEEIILLSGRSQCNPSDVW
jgi:hypothetical protein